jgi:DNA replication protein DnaC
VLFSEEYRSYVSEILIEGHTDSLGTYLDNLALSQQRALAVASYVLDDDYRGISADQKRQLRAVVTANGRSFSDPVLDANGFEDMDASRRVVFKFRLTDEQMIQQLKSILEELDELRLPHMAAELETLYKQPAFVNTGRLELISAIIHAEYIVTVTNRYTSRLKKAKLKGSDSCIDQCVDSKERQYQPQDIIQTLSSLDFVRDGMNLCIFGASDSGKTYLARALGAEACREYRVGYYHCEELASELAAIRKIDFKQYQKKIKAIINLDLVILDDFLLHPITEDYEVKALYDVLEKRNELSRSCIICSQREPKAWPSMLMEYEVSSNSLLKRVTKHYIVMIERKVVD